MLSPCFLTLLLSSLSSSSLGDLIPHCCFVFVQLLQLCRTLGDPMDCSPPGSSVHEISQAGVLGWVAISSSRRSFPPRDRTCLSCVLHWQVGSLSLAPAGFIYHLLWETQISTSNPGLSDSLQALRPAVCWPHTQHVPDRAPPSPHPSRPGSPSAGLPASVPPPRHNFLSLLPPLAPVRRSLGPAHSCLPIARTVALLTL